MIPRWIAVAALVAVGVGGLLVGRQAAPSANAAAPPAAAAASSGAPDEQVAASADAPGLPQRTSTRAPVIVARPADPSAAPAAAPAWVDETPAQRDERHRMIDQRITDTLGDIPAEKRAALIQLNDEAVEVQRNGQVELMQGTLTDAELEEQQHQAVLVQLGEMRDLLTDDEYRRMTGLEPGVDPYEYARTGVGGANLPPPQPETDVSPPPKKP